MVKFKNYFKDLWKAIIGKSRTYSFDDVYGNSTHCGSFIIPTDGKTYSFINGEIIEEIK
jgi:hypothetical protein